MAPKQSKLDTAILTQRTVIRRFRESDTEAFFELMENNKSGLIDHFPTLTKQIGGPEAAERFVNERLSDWLLQKAYYFAIWDNDSARMVGMIMVFDIDWHIPMGEIGFFIDKNFGGKGIMTEVLRHTVHFVFHQLELAKLRFRCLMDNYPAQRLARKAGFRREGDLRDEFKKMGGELADVMLFGLSKAEYEKV